MEFDAIGKCAICASNDWPGTTDYICYGKLGTKHPGAVGLVDQEATARAHPQGFCK